MHISVCGLSQWDLLVHGGACGLVLTEDFLPQHSHRGRRRLYCSLQPNDRSAPSFPLVGWLQLSEGQTHVA